jgi:glycosyltransferase involved in cell wall biosynthesis
MKIGIYARGLSGIGGVKQYIESMSRALIRAVSDEDELFILHNLDAEFFSASASNVHEVLLSSKNKFICDFILAPRAINRLGLDAVWFTKYVIPFGLKAAAVTTVHDMIYYMPELAAYPLGDTVYMRSMIRNSCRRADAVVAVSQNTKQDILRILREQKSKVHVIPEAADAKYRPIKDQSRLAQFRDKYQLPEQFILFTGGISPRKNLLRLFDAFSAVSEQIEHKLVLTGAKGWRNKDIVARVEGRDDIIRLGFVPDEDMPLLYNAASLFVYPSLYEGFGLPILEAAQCGTPVVCARGSSLTEVGGDGVLFVDAADVRDIAEGMLRVVQQPMLRKKLVQRGFAAAKRFSWDASAANLLVLLKEIERPAGR